MILSRYDELYLFCDMGYYNYTPFSLVVHSRVSVTTSNYSVWNSRQSFNGSVVESGFG